jgi:hypothetical protein
MLQASVEGLKQHVVTASIQECWKKGAKHCNWYGKDVPQPSLHIFDRGRQGSSEAHA